MLGEIDVSLIDWSRAQFALTAMYHWVFVPLTLGLGILVAIMETLFVKTGNPEWKRITKFWMTLFGINFAVGVATGLILEFEFGTNWSNYSWFVGDIFGAPLAIEGILAFFLEATFIAVMFFGWNKVNKNFHLLSTWLTVIGANISALWILVANAWMQKPVGMVFNPETARMEMVNFWQVLFSPMAVHKFIHTTSSGFVLSAIFVIGISAWFILKGRDFVFARKSILIASIFGLCAIFYNIISGHQSGQDVATDQPMKFAALEALSDGTERAGLTVWGFVTDSSDPQNVSGKDVVAKIQIPGLMSYLAYWDVNGFVPGVNDLIKGNSQYGILSADKKINAGKTAIEKLSAYKEARKTGNKALADSLKTVITGKDFQSNYFKYLGYGYISGHKYLVPSIPLVFYSFRIMVGLGFYFLLFFLMSLIYSIKGTIHEKRKFLWLAVWSIPLAYIASQAGWIVAELGRQPWVIQDLMPTVAAVTRIGTGAVQVTFWLFAIIFTTLLIAEIKIMLRQIKNGPKNEEEVSHV